MRFEFATRTLKSLISNGILKENDKILTVCAGEAECQLFSTLGFSDVTISNLDSKQTPGAKFDKFPWLYQDAENLTATDGSYDFVFVSDGLHHCRSPHRALLEMFRVARKGVIVLESRDGFLLRHAESMGMVESYEITAVAGNDFAGGGMNNTEIPNFVYRWTEREFEKTIKSFDPTTSHKFQYFYSLEFPHARARAYKSAGKKALFGVASAASKVLGALFPKQGNSFAMVCIKPEAGRDLWPWIELRNEKPTISRAFVEQRLR